MPRETLQIRLSDAEKQRLMNRIEEDFTLAASSNDRYAANCARWLQKWENRIDPPKPGQERKPNHTVPLMQWQVFNKLARDLQSLLGDDAEITAKATGPSDRKLVHKIGRYMTSRVFDQMELTIPLCIFEFRRILFGHSVAYRPWYKREFDVLERGKRKRVCDYEGPGFFPLEPDDFIVPAERGVCSLHEFSFVGRRRFVTVDELYHGAGKEFSPQVKEREFLERLAKWARDNQPERELLAQNQVRDERERSEGRDYDTQLQGNRLLMLWEWYGYWRPLKKASKDSDPDEFDFTKREELESDWVVRYLPGMKEIVGVQDLLDLYPNMRRRRPFFESSLIKDGTYRPKGFGALLEDLEDDATANSRLFTASGELSVWPIIFSKPGNGLNQQAFKVEPGKVYPTEDPRSVNVVTVQPNLQFGILRQQDILAHSERLTGISDQGLGRALDRPNAPKTATGQIALIEQGNIRAYLDAMVLKEDMQALLQDVWDLDCDLVPKTDDGLFFRVTEEQAKGLFDVREDGAYMTPKEFGGRYDFRLKFATSVWARDARQQKKLAFFQIANTTPLVAMNPMAQWSLLDDIARDFDIQFSEIVPRPPELDMPKTPDQEWTLMLQGEYPEVHPMDHDEQHIQEHMTQLEMERKKLQRGEYADEQAIGYGVKHIRRHQVQMQEKKVMNAMVGEIINGLNQDPGNPVNAAIQQSMVMPPEGGGDNSGNSGSALTPLATQTPGAAPPAAPQLNGLTQ